MNEQTGISLKWSDHLYITQLNSSYSSIILNSYDTTTALHPIPQKSSHHPSWPLQSSSSSLHSLIFRSLRFLLLLLHHILDPLCANGSLLLHQPCIFSSTVMLQLHYYTSLTSSFPSLLSNLLLYRPWIWYFWQFLGISFLISIDILFSFLNYIFDDFPSHSFFSIQQYYKNRYLTGPY